MTSEEPSWLILPRPPTLDIPAKDDGILNLTAELPSNSSGALSPDIRVNSPPSFVEQPASSPASSMVVIGKYLLTEKQPEMPNGITVYRAMDVYTREHFVCRAMSIDRCRTVLQPYSIVSPHPNIDEVKEVVMGSTCAYAMHGTLSTSSEDLHAYVRRCRRLPETEAASLFSQILEAVVHCHRHGVVIRDIKLRRFLFADDEKTWLKLDGLYDAAVFDGSDDQLTDKHGCLAYVSPEIIDATFSSASTTTSYPTSPGSASGSYSGRAADMWSLGVMLYTMLVGRYPFADSDACALFSRIRRGRYQTPPEVQLSPMARCLIRSLLAVKPDERLTAEEAVRHPWFASVETDPPHSTSPPSQCPDDGVVPKSRMEIDDDFTAV